MKRSKTGSNKLFVEWYLPHPHRQKDDLKKTKHRPLCALLRDKISIVLVRIRFRFSVWLRTLKLQVEEKWLIGCQLCDIRDVDFRIMLAHVHRFAWRNVVERQRHRRHRPRCHRMKTVCSATPAAVPMWVMMIASLAVAHAMPRWWFVKSRIRHRFISFAHELYWSRPSKSTDRLSKQTANKTVSGRVALLWVSTLSSNCFLFAWKTCSFPLVIHIEPSRN